MPQVSNQERVRSARQALNRELILDAAEAVFAAHGYDAAKMAQIAKAAGMSLTTLYAAFPGKHELFSAVHVRRGRELMVFSLDAIQAGSGPLPMLLVGVRRYVEFHLDHPTFLAMHLRDGGAWAVRPGIRSEAQQTLWDQGLAAATAVFRQGAADGVFVADDEPELLAKTMIAMHQVRLADWVARGGDGGDPAARQQLIRGMQMQAVRSFCRPEAAATIDWERV